MQLWHCWEEHAKLVHNEAALFLAMAIADKVLVGISTVADLREQEIPPSKNELPLIYTAGAEKKVILRRCSKAEGVTDDLMPKSTFVGIYKNG